jgi:hypothetical protein
LTIGCGAVVVVVVQLWHFELYLLTVYTATTIMVVVPMSSGMGLFILIRFSHVELDYFNASSPL